MEHSLVDGIGAEHAENAMRVLNSGDHESFAAMVPPAPICVPVLDVSAIYTSHLDRVYAFFAYRVGRTSDAEDLTSQTFERVVRHAHGFDPDRGGITTWVFAIAEHVLVDHYRRQGRRDERAFDEESAALGAEEGQHAIGIDPRLQEAIAALSERERRVIGLRFGADLSGREIARLIGATEANVHQILSRALRRMRAEIGDASAVRR
jgi:RNA polymerase sigma-70 factor (ECF subfamily)